MKVWDGPRLRESEGFFVRKREGEALREAEPRGHPGGGYLQSTPMPEKTIISQVDTFGAWSTGYVKPGDCRLKIFRCEGGVDLG